MLNLTRVIDRANGYVFLPPETTSAPPGTVAPSEDTPMSQRPNTYALFTTAAGDVKSMRSDIRDVQERWIDARDEWDAYERAQWRREGEVVKEEREKANKIRERKS
jgi:GPN-loop GTPase